MKHEHATKDRPEATPAPDEVAWKAYALYEKEGRPPSLATITLLGICIAVLMLGGCATRQRNATENLSRRLGGAAAGERVTTAELNELTRAFADRYVGLLYSVCDGLKQDNPDPAQRRAAQTLLVDNANNV